MCARRSRPLRDLLGVSLARATSTGCGNRAVGLSSRSSAAQAFLREGRHAVRWSVQFWFLPRLAGALVLAMLAACAPPPAAPTTSTPVSASSPSPAPATAAPSSATTSTPTATDATHPRFAVLVTGVFDMEPVPRYEVSIIDRDGNVVARASAATRSVREIALPAVSVSRTRVYFIDGESQLRSLNVDGTQGPVRPLRIGPEDQAAVAVRPDDRRLAGTLLHWGPHRSPPQAD